ncbi:Gfo/Idh/MocA family protein [Streptomyces sp. NPDC096132]|uniref:Gfo/Idh/MocA family protein n=1 Tax=Streptomyces sp. NPDC096132 TaxID=3366075 RepID=UPI003814DDBB
MTERIGVAVVGAGMAGQAHAYGYRNATMHPDLAGRVAVDLVAVVDANKELAESTAARYGFATAHADIQAILDDPAVDAVSVALPNNQYIGVIPRLLAAGKHVMAEKPLGRTAAEALQLARTAEKSGLVHAISFSWRRLAAVEGIAKLVREGAIGEPRHFSAWYLTDYAANPEAPLSWRYDRALAGGGAILDIGPHIVSVLEHVLGRTGRVVAADMRTVVPERPVPAGAVVGHGPVATTGERGPVTTDDVTTAITEFASGVTGHITVSRVATGVPNSLGFHLIGSTGSIRFDSVHPDEFELFTSSPPNGVTNGSRTVIVGPEYDSFAHTIPMPARGVGSGYGAGFVAQVQEFLGAIAGNGTMQTDFFTGYRAMLVCSAAQRAAATASAVDLAALDTELRAASSALTGG